MSVTLAILTVVAAALLAFATGVNAGLTDGVRFLPAGVLHWAAAAALSFARGVMSLSKVRVRTHVLAPFLGMLPGTAMWVHLGSLAPTVVELSPAVSGGGTTRTVLYVSGLAATVGAAVIGPRAARRALNAQLQEPTSP